MSFKIIGTGSYAPLKVISNEELVATLDTSAEWVKSKLGIDRRHICEGERTSDLAYQASLKALRMTSASPEEIDCIIVASITPDQKVPSTSTILKHKLGLKNNAPCFDIAAACSGFLYSLEMANNFFLSGKYKKILIVGCDSMSTMVDWKRRDCVFFGDGAGAVLLERNHEPGFIFQSIIGAETLEPYHFNVPYGETIFQMDPNAVFNNGSRLVSQTVLSLCEKNNLSLDQVKMIIPHQASVTMLKNIANLLNIPFEKMRTNMSEYANTSSGTIPILLDEINRREEISVGDIIVFASVGAGWTYGAALYQWR